MGDSQTNTNIIIMRLEVVLLFGALTLVSAYYIKDEDAGGNPERSLSEAEGMLLRERRDAEPAIGGPERANGPSGPRADARARRQRRIDRQRRGRPEKMQLR